MKQDEWKCTHCGKCCLTIPCVFARVKHNITSGNGRMCPELVKDVSGYRCLLIENDPEARKVLVSGDCDDPALSHLKRIFDASVIVKEVFPEATEEEAHYILWNYTGYPEFWNIPEDGWTASQCLRKQLNELKQSRLKVSL